MSFFDAFGMMFDPDDDPRRRNAAGTDDDPVILNVETDGDDASHRTPPPQRPAGPRIARRPERPRGNGRGSRILIGVVVALVVVVGLFFGLSRFITDLMWYGQLGFQSVIWTQLGVRVGVWVAYALLVAVVGFLSATLAIHARPADDDGSTVRIHGDVVEIANGISSKHARMVAVIVALVVGVAFGSQFNANWSDILLMFNAQSFGTTDLQFGLDNGFYVFILPGLKLVMSAVSTMLLVGIVFSVITHVLMGGIRRSVRHHQARPPSARRLADAQHVRVRRADGHGGVHPPDHAGRPVHRRELHIGACHHPRHVRHGRVGGHPERGARRLADDLARAGG